MSAIVFKKLTKRFDDKTVIADVTLDAPARSLTVVVGPSGCGKSTLLSIAAGLETPCAGSVSVSGRAVSGPSPDTALIFQDHNLFPWLDACGNIAFGLEMRGASRKASRARALALLHEVGLGECAARVPRELSGGMRQRVALLRALALNPKVILLDEPFASLDYQTRKIMQAHLLATWRKSAATAVLVTHDLHEALYLADRLVLFSGSPGRVREVIDIDLPRPRDLNHPFLAALYRRMEDHLESEAAASEFTEAERRRFRVGAPVAPN
jgi:NitT/TauT family transport system ATP-binding protein